jgi:hypothetical protein
MQESHNPGGDPLKVEMMKPKECRERQKLLREQNILKQVGFIVFSRFMFTLYTPP